MVWSWHEKGPISDREAGLYLSKSNQGRDDFFFKIKTIDGDQVVITFEATPRAGRFLDDIEKEQHPGFSYKNIYMVAWNKNLIGKEKIIQSALQAFSNNLQGYSGYYNGEGIRSLVEIEYVDHIEGI